VLANPINVNRKSKLRIASIITCYNEEDIIESTIRYYLYQNIDVFVIDNWSTDKSYKIIKNLQKKHKNIYLLKYPENNPTPIYEWKNLLKKIEQIAKNSNYNWYLHNDSDEIRFSPWENKNLREGIEIVDSFGYNSIDFTVIDFRYTTDLNNKTFSFKNYDYFEFGKRPGHFLQIKCWKKTKNIDLSSSGGHEIVLPNRKIFPLKFLSKHYPLRNHNQAKQKLSFRLTRLSEEEIKMGWHTHIKNLEIKKVYSKKHLIKFDQSFFEKYLVERISGIGILTEDKHNYKNIDELKNHVKNQKSQLIKLQNYIQNLKTQINQQQTHIQNLETQLNTIKSSKFFKLWQTYCKIRDKLLFKS
ncbi:MAG: glycosyltransferase, partial [Microgenomates group bacterium]